MSLYLIDTPRGPVSVTPEEYLLQSRKVFIEGEITSVLANDTIRQLMLIEKEDDRKPVTVYVNSPGGEVTAGLAIYDFISMMKSPVTMVVTGLAASIAAVIYLSVEKSNRLMLPNARIMIHDPAYGGTHDVARLKPHEIQSQLDDLNKCREKLARIISNRTGQPLETILEVTKNDSYFNLDEAVEFGLAGGGVSYDILF